MQLLHCPHCGSKLMPRKENGYERLFCPKCSTFVYENPVPVVAAVILDEKERVLLVKRGVEPCIGTWTLPSGFIEMGEHPDACVLREAKEETNLECKIRRLLGVYHQKGWRYRSVIVLAYLLDTIGGEPRAGDDAVAIGYYGHEALPDIPFSSHRDIIHDLFQTMYRTVS
jgi:ADP-ribose pyrophosphatase YjhB (NUDIX family)